jgi:hypothetical protein
MAMIIKISKYLSDIIVIYVRVPDGIIRPVVSVSAMTWFIRYIYYWNLQILDNVIFIKTNVLLPQA